MGASGVSKATKVSSAMMRVLIVFLNALTDLDVSSVSWVC